MCMCVCMCVVTAFNTDRSEAGERVYAAPVNGIIASVATSGHSEALSQSLL
jgi:hypothetical protein